MKRIFSRMFQAHGRDCPCQTCLVLTLHADGKVTEKQARRLLPWYDRPAPLNDLDAAGIRTAVAMCLCFSVVGLPLGLLIWGPMASEISYRRADAQ